MNSKNLVHWTEVASSSSFCKAATFLEKKLLNQLVSSKEEFDSIGLFLKRIL